MLLAVFTKDYCFRIFSKHSESFADYLVGDIILCASSNLKHNCMNWSYLKCHHWSETMCKNVIIEWPITETFGIFRKVSEKIVLRENSYYHVLGWHGFTSYAYKLPFHLVIHTIFPSTLFVIHFPKFSSLNWRTRSHEWIGTTKIQDHQDLLTNQLNNYFSFAILHAV